MDDNPKVFCHGGGRDIVPRRREESVGVAGGEGEETAFFEIHF